MAKADTKAGDACVIACEQLQSLLDALTARGYQPVGPSVREGAIVYDEIKSVGDLPAGWTDRQDPGKYRLTRRSDGALFGYVISPHSWKKYLHPPVIRLWQGDRTDGTFKIAADRTEPPRLAFVGVRACELAAIAVQDEVFLHGRFVDPVYRARRERTFLVAVNCGQASSSCFCSSMMTGPRCTSGFDIALTEILEEGRHDFVVESGTPQGAEVVAGLEGRPAIPSDMEAARRVTARAVGQITKTLNTVGIRDLLMRNIEHPRWDHVADRCLTCANCTMVCPTCFCTTVEDVTDLGGRHAERWRKWDSCFTVDFSYIYGGHVRSSAMSRYRQWMTHKLATWFDQFGSSGCVGCGRCITWCPVGIDITEEARAIRETDQTRKEDSHGVA